MQTPLFLYNGKF